MPQYQGVWTLPVAARLQSTQQWATDPLYRNTTLLLQADNAPNGAQNNTFLDSSSNNFTITRNGNTTQGTFTPFSQSPGWWGNFFNGTTDFLSLTQVSLTGDFTIEAWLWFNTGASNPIPVGQLSGPTNKQALAYSSGFQYYQSNGGGNVTGTIPLGLNQWIHLAVSRVSGTVRIFTNGALDGSTADTSTFSFNRIGCIASGTAMLNGYISNLRVLDGTGLYTTSFTPSSIPLTAITNTALLTCQSNAFVDTNTQAAAKTLTVNGTPSVQAFSPFAPQYQWTAPVIGGSTFFDGTGDYLQIANNTVLTPTGDFTIEFWAYVTDSSGTQEWYSKGYGIQVYIAGGVWGTAFSSSNNSTYYVNYATVPVITNAWTHVATTRSGNTYRLFINGVETNSATSSSAPNTGTDVLRLGEWSLGTTFGAKGYMAGVRYLNGTALYTSNFTPPTSPPTAITNTQLLTNFTNAGIVDGTMKNNLETVGNAQVSTSVVKYGTGSMYFDGSGDWLLAPNSANLAFNTGDFTIECWVYPTASPSYACIIDTRNGFGTGGFGLFITSGTGLQIFTSVGVTIFTGTSCITTNTWQHVVVCRSGTSLRVFVNGTQIGSTITNSANMSDGYLIIGNALAADRNYPLTGYIDDLRVTKGVARYTANFTPPTVALPRQ